MGFTSLHSFLEIYVLLYAGHECLLVCLFLEDEKNNKQTTLSRLQLSQKASFKLSTFILPSDAEGNK